MTGRPLTALELMRFNRRWRRRQRRVRRTGYPVKNPPTWVYVEGADRNNPDAVRSHVYTGPGFRDLRGPLCRYGWNRSDGQSFSILRGYVSSRGTCKSCERRMAAGRGPVPPTAHPTKWL